MSVDERVRITIEVGNQCGVSLAPQRVAPNKTRVCSTFALRQHYDPRTGLLETRDLRGRMDEAKFKRLLNITTDAQWYPLE